MKKIREQASVSKASRLGAMSGSAPKVANVKRPKVPIATGATGGIGDIETLPPISAKRGGPVKRASGGAVKMTAGAGTGEGRLQKVSLQKKSK